LVPGQCDLEGCASGENATGALELGGAGANLSDVITGVAAVVAAEGTPIVTDEQSAIIAGVTNVVTAIGIGIISRVKSGITIVVMAGIIGIVAEEKTAIVTVICRVITGEVISIII
jgi:hypothetical protein